IPQEVSKANGKDLLVNDQNKYKSMWIRAYSSLWMLASFLFVLYMGHLYIWAMVVVIQIFMTRELFNLLRRAHEDRRFMWFILTLKKKMYKYQFGQYAWTHMILIVVFTQSAFTLANILGQFQWLTCPRKDLTTGWLQCDPGPLFKAEYYSLPGWIPHWDFGDSIPGHGGFTDRMDCQMVMAVFAYIYLQSFVVPQDYTVEMILDQIMRSLTSEEQLDLYMKLGERFRERQFRQL
ncbi:hypothetical protein Tsubulata_043059, partial [Turnera subulata]